MNTWKPISQSELSELLRLAEEEMTPKEKRYWEAVRMSPEKWQEETYGREGGGFWVVALLGKNVLWYNDIEDGFNVSQFSEYGKIDGYWCNQDELLHVIRRFAHHLEYGA